MKSSYQINQELVAYFISYLEANSDKAEGTIANVARDLKAFIEYLNDYDADIQAKYIMAYINHLEDKYMESSFLSKLSSIRQFINWLNLEENPFWKLKISLNYNEFDYYKKSDLETKFPLDAFSYDALIVWTIYELCLSQEELIGLNLEDYNLANSSFNLRGNKIKISDQLANQYKIYLKEIRATLLGKLNSMSLKDPLLLRTNINAANIDAYRLTTIDLQKLLQLHELKHIYLKRSRIMNLLDQGLSLEQIETKLAIKLGNFYRPFVKDQDYRLAKAYKDYHPRARIGS